VITFKIKFNINKILYWNQIFFSIFRLFIPLPKLSSEGYRVSLSRIRTPEVDNFEFADYVKVNFMSIDIRLSKLDMFKKEIFVFDLKDINMFLLTAMLPHMKKFVYCATVSIFYFYLWNYKRLLWINVMNLNKHHTGRWITEIILFTMVCVKMEK